MTPKYSSSGKLWSAGLEFNHIHQISLKSKRRKTIPIIQTMIKFQMKFSWSYYKNISVNRSFSWKKIVLKLRMLSSE